MAEPLRRTLDWAAGVEVVPGEDGGVAIVYPGGRAALQPGAAERALAAVGDRTSDDDAVADAWAGDDGVQALIEGYSFVEWLRRTRLVDEVLRSAAGRPIAAVGGVSGHPQPGPLPPLAVGRNVYARLDGDALVVAQPATGARLRVLDLSALLALPLARALRRGRPVPTDDRDAELVGMLAEGRLLEEAGAGGDLADPLATWEFHDLLLHQRSRVGQHAEALGGTFPYAGRLPPEPASFDRKFPDGALVELAVPDLSGGGPGLYDVLEHRASVRRSERVISSADLGAVLYASARITRHDPAGDEPTAYPATRRPYPTGGAAYDLEIYPVVRRCDGIAPGIHYYNPSTHVLEQVSGDEGAVAELTGMAALATAGLADPQVLLVVTSRFRRLSWKYRSIAYATTLKNVGTLYQTLYLVATAMGLSPCALGTGSSTLFARATGLDLHTESSVGEFLLAG